MNSTHSTQGEVRSIMRRVYAVWLLRSATRPAMVRFYILLVGLFEIVRTVSLSNVFTNMSQHNTMQVLPFFQRALLHTEVAVQVALLATLVGGVYVMRDVFLRRELFLHKHITR